VTSFTTRLSAPLALASIALSGCITATYRAGAAADVTVVTPRHGQDARQQAQDRQACEYEVAKRIRPEGPAVTSGERTAYLAAYGRCMERRGYDARPMTPDEVKALRNGR
jgi:hypothetical protein